MRLQHLLLCAECVHGRCNLRRAVASVRSPEGELSKLLALAAGCGNVVVFSGSGLSAPSGEGTIRRSTKEECITHFAITHFPVMRSSCAVPSQRQPQ